MSHRSVLISGVGIAGPTLAYWLLQRGLTPTLVERAPAPRQGGYMIDFWGVGYDVAERMELVPALREDAYALQEVRLVGASGKRVAGFDAREFSAATNGRFLSILRDDLANRIFERVSGEVETIFGDSVTSLDEDAAGISASFEHAPARRFDLVIGADGLHSNIRRLTVGEAAPFEKYLGYCTAAFIANDYPHRDEGAYLSYSTPGRQLARYALRGGRSAFFFIFAQREPLAPIDDVAGQKALLRQRFSGMGWESDEILEAMDQTSALYFDAVAQTQMSHWSESRVALVGDAAYCPSLLSGQGSAFAMAGAYVLAQALAESPSDHEAAFADYQRRFKPFVDDKQRAARRFAQWFAPRSTFGVRVRNVVTNMLGLPFIGGQIAARSFGDTFDLQPEHAVSHTRD